ncbi:hypothetical protein RND81_09G072600 [Saponaria officinalis]|uniref:Interactor of constitutive active ROPs 3 n=1 Tax=Saponaria officinalis TaxID=3572 RepID=A0AAW1IJ25_SAPOF
MQNTKGRASPKESPQKSSLRPARELKLNPVERNSSSPSSNVTFRTPKDKSPKVTDRRSSRSPICEKKRPSKLSELESQLSKLQNDLKTVKDQLVVSESSKNEAHADAEDVKRKLADVSLKLEESQKQLSELNASKHATVVDQWDISQEQQEWESKIEAARQQQLHDSASLKCALDEIQNLREQLEGVSELKDVQKKENDMTQFELHSLKNNLAETSSLVESMRYELEQTKDSEAQAQNLVKQTLLQLEAAKDTINALRIDIVNSKEANDSVHSELQQSRAHVSFLESFVDNLKKINSDQNLLDGESTNQGIFYVDELQRELQATQSEVRQLKSTLEVSEIRYNEERSCSKKQIEGATEILNQIKSQSSIREAELTEELKKASANICELKATLMDKETELQGISEENENLNTKLENSELCNRDQEMEAELAKLREHVAEMKANLMDKETELQNVFSENDMLKLEISKPEMDTSVEAAEVEAARAAEAEALMKLELMMDEVDKSKRKVARVTEQLEAAQSASADMEAELRRLKVQSDQWRKAAEAAASMLSPGSNGKYVERSGSMPLGGKYSPVNSSYLDDYDDDSFKKKNGNVLKKIGVLWKKPQK